MPTNKYPLEPFLPPTSPSNLSDIYQYVGVGPNNHFSMACHAGVDSGTLFEAQGSVPRPFGRAVPFFPSGEEFFRPGNTALRSNQTFSEWVWGESHSTPSHFTFGRSQFSLTLSRFQPVLRYPDPREPPRFNHREDGCLRCHHDGGEDVLPSWGGGAGRGSRGEKGGENRGRGPKTSRRCRLVQGTRRPRHGRELQILHCTRGM